MCSTSQGALGDQKSEDTSPRHPLRGSGALRSLSASSASYRRSGPAPQTTVGRSWVCGPHSSSETAAYCAAGLPDGRVVLQHRLQSCAHSAPTMRASQAVMEVRQVIQGGKSTPRRCFEKPQGRSRYAWGSSRAGHCSVPFTRQRKSTKSVLGRGGGGE